MRDRAVDHLTRARGIPARWTPTERRAAAAIAAAWAAGSLLAWTGLDAVPARWAAARLDPGPPSPAALAERLPAGDPRVEWYAAGLALREERRRAASGPARIDPASADRADWDRLPGIGPVTAAAILALRESRGGFERPEDLLEVRGIGPKRLERLRPWLEWDARGDPPRTALPDAARAPRGAPPKPDLNRLGAAELAAVDGIGPHLATVILRERGRRGGFRDWADVRAIEGVGPTRLAALQNATRLTDPRSYAERETSEER